MKEQRKNKKIIQLNNKTTKEQRKNKKIIQLNNKTTKEQRKNKKDNTAEQQNNERAAQEQKR
jgi:hypothetical protein